MSLGEYLAAARLRPWAWHEHDCCSFPAAWAGVDLPAYTSEAEADAMMAEAGGLVPLWERAAEGKAEAVLTLQPGDVGVIELPTIETRSEVDEETGETIETVVIVMVECGAIWTGKRWAFVPRAGGIAAISSAQCLKAWRPLCPRP